MASNHDASAPYDGPWTYADGTRRRPDEQQQTHGESGPDADRQRRIGRLRFLGRLLDSQWKLPGTNATVGLDGLLGLIPGVGDVITTGISCYILFEAKKLGASKTQLARMTGRVVLDLLMGSIPVFGDAADFVYKANRLNLRDLGIDVDPPPGDPQR